MSGALCDDLVVFEGHSVAFSLKMFTQENKETN